jgi:threonine synthase
VHGAKLIQVDANFDEALVVARDLVEKYPVTLVNSVNPYRIEGQKTGAFEVCGALGRAPDYHVMPVGNAGNITAYWKGYREERDANNITFLPRMFGFQAAGSAPIVEGHPIEKPSTIATAIRIGNPASWTSAVEAARDSEGAIRAVTDRDILNAYRQLAREGIFVEMASAASIAGLLSLGAEGLIARGKTVVCILTGHGLKDPDWAIAGAPTPAVVPADADAAARELGL